MGFGEGRQGIPAFQSGLRRAQQCWEGQEALSSASGWLGECIRRVLLFWPMRERKVGPWTGSRDLSLIYLCSEMWAGQISIRVGRKKV